MIDPTIPPHQSTPPTSQEMDALTRDLRDVAHRLHDMAWDMPLRDVGRLLARVASEMASDATRLDMLFAVAMSYENLSPEKKADLERTLALVAADNTNDRKRNP